MINDITKLELYSALFVVGTILLAISINIRLRRHRKRISLGKSRSANPQSITIGNSSGTVEVAEDFRSILFADATLEELQTVLKGDTKDENDWLALFRNAYNATQNGDRTTAIDYMTRILKQPNSETRIQLWAWNALRELGELPSESDEKIIQGVVLEIPTNGALDTMAVYQDGRVRYFNGKLGLAGGVIWEAPGANPQIASLVTEVLKSAAPLFALNPRHVLKHPPSNRQSYRVTLLTFGGLYVIEVPDTNKISAVVVAGARLLDALTELVKKPNNGSVGHENIPTASAPQSMMRARLFSLAFFALSLIALPFYVNIYISHSYFDEKALLVILIPAIYGFAGLFDPRILFMGTAFLNGKAKLISLSLIPVVVICWLGLTKVLNDSYAIKHPSQGITVENDEAFNAIAAQLAPKMDLWRKTASDQSQSVLLADVGLADTDIKSIVYGRCPVDGFYVFLIRTPPNLQSGASIPNAYNFSTEGDHFTSYTEGCTPKGWFVLRKIKLGNGWWASVAIP